MGKSFFDEADEERGSLPALTGALLEIVSIERSKTSDKAKNPGLRMYVVQHKVVEPKKFAGTFVTDWITVGSPDDPFAKRPETWKRSEGGPGRLKRLLTRAGVPLSDDDEEWMEAAEGHQIVAPISAKLSDDGDRTFNRPGLYYRPSDEDCPEIGEAEAKPKGKAGRPGKPNKGKAAKGEETEGEEDEKPTKPAKSTKTEDTDDDEDESPKPKSKAKKPAKDDDEDEE